MLLSAVCGLPSNEHPDVSTENIQRTQENLNRCMSRGEAIPTDLMMCALYIRHLQKTRCYEYASAFYDALDKGCFVFPLLLLQAIIGIALVAIRSPLGENWDEKVLSGVIASISSVLVALQTKLNWSKRSEQFKLISHVHYWLALRAHQAYVRTAFYSNAGKSQSAYSMATNSDDEEKTAHAADTPRDEVLTFLKEQMKVQKSLSHLKPCPQWISAKFSTFDFPLGVITHFKGGGRIHVVEGDAADEPVDEQLDDHPEEKIDPMTTISEDEEEEDYINPDDAENRLLESRHLLLQRQASATSYETM